MKKFFGFIVVLMLALSIVACKPEKKKDDVTITVNPTTVSIKEGETATVTATISDATLTATWESSDETIATVANGVITGVKEGTTTITAKAAKASAHVTVTVTKKAAEPVAPTLDTVKTAVQAILADYASAQEVSFKLRAVGEKTQTTEVAYHITDSAITDFEYVLTGAKKASLYVKDGMVYIYNINDDQNKSSMAMTPEEATTIASTYGFAGITATSLAWAYEDAFWAVASLDFADAESAEISIDLATYAGEAIKNTKPIEGQEEDPKLKIKAKLSVSYAEDGSIALISLAIETKGGAHTSISLWFNGLADIAIEFPDFNEYN